MQPCGALLRRPPARVLEEPGVWLLASDKHFAPIFRAPERALFSPSHRASFEPDSPRKFAGSLQRVRLTVPGYGPSCFGPATRLFVEIAH